MQLSVLASIWTRVAHPPAWASDPTGDHVIRCSLAVPCSALIELTDGTLRMYQPGGNGDIIVGWELRPAQRRVSRIRTSFTATPETPDTTIAIDHPFWAAVSSNRQEIYVAGQPDHIVAVHTLEPSSGSVIGKSLRKFATAEERDNFMKLQEWVAMVQRAEDDDIVRITVRTKDGLVRDLFSIQRHPSQ